MSSGPTTAAAMPRFQPWQELLNPAALSLPSSLSDATTRLFQNAFHFLPNYAAILLILVLLRLALHPAAFLLALAAAAFFLATTLRRGGDGEGSPLLAISGLGGVVLAVLVFAAVVAVVTSGLVGNVVVSAVVGGLVVGLHAVLRSTDDLVNDDRGSPFGELVGPTDDRGTYTIL